MNMVSALIPSAILTMIVSALVGLAGGQSGFLNLQEVRVFGYAVYWSWTLFFVAMALNGGLVLAIRGRSQPAGEVDSAA